MYLLDAHAPQKYAWDDEVVVLRQREEIRRRRGYLRGGEELVRRAA